MLGTFGAYKYKPAAFIVLAKSPGGTQDCSCADERLYVVSPLFLYFTVTFLSCGVTMRTISMCFYVQGIACLDKEFLQVFIDYFSLH